MLKKERKKTVDEIKIIDCFKKCVEKYADKTNYINSVSIYEQSTKENFRVVATLDCGSFQQRIIYYSMFSFEENFVDTEFSFENSEYSYLFYDIFNLFDIEDFNLYYYSGVETAEETEKAVKEIFETTENYFYYLEKAGSEAYLSELIKNYETDMDTSWGDYDWREEEKDIDDVFFAPLNHPSMTLADGNITEKTIKKLKNKYEKGKLDTIYEKRLLKYIEAGNKFERKNISDKEEFEKLYLCKDIIMDVILFIASFILCIAVRLVVHSLMFSDAVMYSDIENASLLSYDNITALFLAAIALTIEIRILFGKKIIAKIMPENMKSRVEDRYKKDGKDRYGKLAKPLKIIVAIIAPLFIYMLFLISFYDVGYYDTYVRYNVSFFEAVDVNYEDLEVYKVKYSYEDEEEMLIENENYYAISDRYGNIFEYGELEQGGETETKLKEIAEKNNKKIVELDTMEELYLSFSE
ncbi:MAG: hypothetical protein K2J59_00230 [Eubacterium sp.]|nr:hypothetical protein [Eubacterium sp.]